MLVRTSSPAPACPHCNSTDLRKKVSTFAAVTATASAAFGEMPAACQSCGASGGAGACGYHQA
jgi:hypothetical protein